MQGKVAAWARPVRTRSAQTAGPDGSAAPTPPVHVGLLLSRLLRAHPDDDWAPLLEGRLRRATLRQKVKVGQALVTVIVAAITALLPDLVAHFARDQRAYKASRTIFLLAVLSSALVASHLVDLAVGRRRRPSLS